MTFFNRGILYAAVFCVASLFNINTAHAALALSLDGKYKVDRLARIKIENDPATIEATGEPITTLRAHVRVPVSQNTNTSGSDEEDLYPTVIFITSWGAPVVQYDEISRRLARLGYVVISYAPRGFGFSGGQVGTGSPLDVSDGQRVIDWAIENYPVNPDAIGLSGVSYGAGISYLIATKDKRIRAIVGLSGWTDLLESLAPNSTGRKDWLALLQILGNVAGNLNPDVNENLDSLNNTVNIPYVVNWAEQRSSIYSWDNINNQVNPPAIYTVTNRNDYLFQTDNSVNIMREHKGPKRFDMHLGSHAIPETLAQFDENDEVWGNAIAWFDHYLYGKNNGIQCLKPINYVVDSRSFIKPPQESVNSLKSVSEYDTTRYFLTTSNNSKKGQLSSTPHASGDQILTYNTDKWEVSSGFLIEQFLKHPDVNMRSVDIKNAVIFEGPSLEKDMDIRGNVELVFHAQAPMSSQYFAYLVEVNPITQKGTWISHAPFTVFPRDGSTFSGAPLRTIDFDLYWTAYNAKKGNKLVLIIDSNDPGYNRLNNAPATSTLQISNIRQSTLSFRTLKAEAPYMTLANSNAQQLNCANDNPSGIVLGKRLASDVNNVSVRQASNKSGAVNIYFLISLLTYLVFRQRKYSLRKN